MGQTMIEYYTNIKQKDCNWWRKKLAISGIQMQITCDIPVLFENGIPMPISYPQYTWQKITHSRVIDILCPLMR